MNELALALPMNHSENSKATVFNYHLLRQALDRFQKNIPRLNQSEFEIVEQSANRSWQLECQVLQSDEANRCVISDEEVEASYQQVRERYQNEIEFINDLHANGLDESTLYQALQRELKFDAVMQLVSKDAVQINELDIRLFYELHDNRFELPEKRVVRHILITINDEFAENTRQAALQRIHEIEEKMHGRINRFERFAQRYSECPTAMEGGKLGEVQRGHLYPEIDAVLFSMEESSISDVVESEMGFHLLYCEKIIAAKKIPLNTVRDKIERLLHDRQVRNCQKSWLKQLHGSGQDHE